MQIKISPKQLPWLRWRLQRPPQAFENGICVKYPWRNQGGVDTVQSDLHTRFDIVASSLPTCRHRICRRIGKDLEIIKNEPLFSNGQNI